MEALDGDFVRVHLWALAENKVTPEALAERFAASAAVECGSGEEMEKRLGVLLELAGEGKLPFPLEEAEEAVTIWRQQGYPACHHSEQFRAAYAPAYRVLLRAHAEELLGKNV